MADDVHLPPRAGSLPHAGTYRRTLPVSLERLYENALDWEHLPHVHADSFSRASVVDSGAWGWRARLTTAGGREVGLELVLDRLCRRWITRALEGFGAGTEIWTHAFPVAAARVDIVVDFFVPGRDAVDQARVGQAYARHYARLYDEDVAMMGERQRQIDIRLERPADAARHVTVGQRRELVLPMPVSLAGRRFVLVEAEGVLAAFPAQCPHQLGPLHEGEIQGRVVTCPWHGDRFDVVTGDNLSGRPCRLSHQPEVIVEADDTVRLVATH